MNNWPLRPERERTPNIIGNKWLKDYFTNKNIQVTAVMLAIYNIGQPVPVIEYYDVMGIRRHEIQYELDMTGDPLFDKCMELAKGFAKSHKTLGLKDSLSVYVYINLLYFLDEDICKREIGNLLKSKAPMISTIPAWIIDLKEKLDY